MYRYKVVARIKGGIGNQLFCFAAARAVALRNNADLVLDDLSGFSRDFTYKRQYALDRFSIPCRVATASERLEPFARLRRALLVYWSQRVPYAKRRYHLQNSIEFDVRLVNLKLCSDVYLDGYWQSEMYFADIEHTLRNELRFEESIDDENRKLGERMATECSVSVHVRCFDRPGIASMHNIGCEYYKNAIPFINSRCSDPRYYVFADNSSEARKVLGNIRAKISYVDWNTGDKDAHKDLWLMSKCRHHIIANSTFSWWGAWLANSPGQLVTTPVIHHRSVTAWSFAGLIPDRWQELG